jgi:TetR/AcrR family tetracycline transcriptional repressor
VHAKSPSGPDPTGSLAAIASLGGGRGRPRKLDRAAVTRAALMIVAEDGLAGLTMRRVADRLEVGLATLYNTVGSKEAILEDMIEAVFDQLPDRGHQPGREFEDLVELWVATHGLLVANPVVAQLIALRRFGGSGLFGLVEDTLALLRGTGVSDDLITTAFETIRGYALGFSLLRVSRSSPAAAEARSRLIRESSSTQGRYPEIVARAAEIAGAITAEQFDLGLRHLIQGFLPREHDRH